MNSNFNTAPSAHQEQLSSWDFSPSSPSANTEMTDWSSQNWAESPESTTFDSWDTPAQSYEAATDTQSRVSERLRELKDKAVHGLGRKALDAVMNRLPSFSGKDMVASNLTTAYEDPAYRQGIVDSFSDVRSDFGGYRDQATQFAVGAGREVAGAGITAAKETVMNYYGLEKDENEKLRVARKLKFGKAVVKTLVNPVGTASSVGVRAGHAARKAAKSEGYNQLRSARTNVIEMSSQYAPNTDSFDNWGTPRAA